ncbi:MAG TPA: ArsR family transcriptional regulator [Candidatus Thermoplasmatota archaeon]|nr:ArsR family transcriptional regulator [Candidatus Thermoplasmatota archaeon]
MKTKEEALELDARRHIYEHILATPGTHLRGVHRAVRLPFGQVLYHLNYLEKLDLVVVKKDGKFSRYFVKNLIGRQEKNVISVLRHEVPRTISVLLLFHDEMTHKQILEHVGVSPSTLSFHLAKMVDAEVVTREQRGRESIYRLVDRDLTTTTLIRHRASFQCAVVDRFCQVFDAFAEGEGEARRLPSPGPERARELLRSILEPAPVAAAPSSVAIASPQAPLP